jgi:hypothetical protein
VKRLVLGITSGRRRRRRPRCFCVNLLRLDFRVLAGDAGQDGLSFRASGPRVPHTICWRSWPERNRVSLFGNALRLGGLR